MSKSKPLIQSNERIEMLAYLKSGLNDEEIAKQSGWDAEKIERLRSEAMAAYEQQLLSQRPEDIYVRYFMEMERGMAQCEAVIDKFNSSNQGSAIVGAIKAKADLLDRAIKMGQDLDFIKKAPTKIVVAHMSSQELAVHLTQRMERLQLKAQAHGDRKFIDVSYDDLPPSGSPKGQGVEDSKKRSDNQPRIRRRRPRRRSREKN